MVEYVQLQLDMDKELVSELCVLLLEMHGNITELKNSSSHQCIVVKFLDGIETRVETPNSILAAAIEGALPAEFASTLDWCKHLMQNCAELEQVLINSQYISKME